MKCDNYNAHYLKTMNGFLILAADGSDINIPTTEETLELYGTSSRKGTKPQASLGLSGMYDDHNYLTHRKNSSLMILANASILSILCCKRIKPL
ncbi:hypothetical protein Ga0466249_004495 [Sporomusaceae bacterium BoRhaA]|uniref:hypothetical protein n=1 Tax=Pelorhabdus rhamnosifermentans TaxID=2772457 RepID=UPI001C0641F6|nr:hypothetical protein [Pelorhabdus rhamnosifermentans]MBU2703350.1 hypothetical protein [Pelorhabdus rhamnosifermentans]